MTSQNDVLDGQFDLGLPADAAIADLRNESRMVRSTLSALGRLLGAALIDPPRNLKSFIAEHLGVSATEVASVNKVLFGVDVPLVHVAVARLLERTPGAILTDDTGTGAPGYELVTVDVDEQLAAPDDLAAFIPAEQGFGFDAVLVLTWAHQCQQISLTVRSEDRHKAQSALADLVARAVNEDNFYRGKSMQVQADDNGVRFTPVPPSAVARQDLVHTAAVWAEVDANVTGLVKHAGVLVAAGLGASRGVLVVGGPGVGKTALCRVIASELPPGTTVLIVDAGVTARGLGLLYDSLARLAPAAVFLDDIDLLAGDRRGHTGGDTLRELLTHLDGFTPTAAVLTVATTNDLGAVDPALTRAGRFDSVIEVGPPDRAARELILRRYLRPFGDFDVAGIAAATEGATGSDLREVVRRTVLEHGAQLTVADLLDVVRTGRWKPAVPIGQYL